MCIPKPPKDNSADIARAEESARQKRINQGQQGIDAAFSGFNDDLYNKYQTDYTNYYNPQIDDQYGDAVKRLTLQLAQTGNLSGSTGVDQLAKLKQYRDQQKLSLTNKATEATNALRGNIDAKKSQLYADNRAVADPGNASSAAASAAQYLQPSQPSSPLANVFGDFFSNLGNVSALQSVRRMGNSTGVQAFGGGNSDSVYVRK